MVGTRDIESATIVVELVEEPVVGSGSPKSGFLMLGTLTVRQRIGYTMVAANGTSYAFGGIDHRGNSPVNFATGNVVDIERTPSGGGYWVVNDAGQVFAYGDARYLGGADALRVRVRATHHEHVRHTHRQGLLAVHRGRARAAIR